MEGDAPPPTFKEQYVELQMICLELDRVRKHNLTFTKVSPLDPVLFFSEGLLVLLALERFLRAVVRDSKQGDTLYNLLQQATSKERNLVTLPGTLPREEAIKAIVDVRNTITHGNYEQAAAGARRQNVQDYFGSGTYITEVQILFELLENFMKQIDENTGLRRAG